MKWQDIIGYEGRYMINEIGQVKSLLRDIILADRYNTKGYLHVALYSSMGNRRDVMVHRLVAKHFIPPIPKKPVVNHKNLNKKDNRVCNLEWVDIPENVRHYLKNKL